MLELILFIGTFVVVYLIYLFVIILKNKTYRPHKIPIEARYLKERYKIDLKSVNYKKMMHIISLVSALDIAIVVSVISLFDHIVLQMIIGFVILFPIILISYHIVGKCYQKKGSR